MESCHKTSNPLKVVKKTKKGEGKKNKIPWCLDMVYTYYLPYKNQTMSVMYPPTNSFEEKLYYVRSQVIFFVFLVWHSSKITCCFAL